MTIKLTLTIDDKIICSAKKYAQKKGKSLSHLVENYLKLISKMEIGNLPASPKVSKIRGIIDLPNDFDYKNELSNSLSKSTLSRKRYTEDHEK